MRYTTPFLAAALLAVSVSPLVAQQDDTPEPPASAEPAQAEPVEAEPAEAVEDAQPEADAAEQAEPDDHMVDDNNGPILQAEIAPAQGQIQAQQLVIRGAIQFAQPGGLNGQVRNFNDDIAGLPELVMCAVTDGVTRDADPASYRFEAETPGLLTVAVRAKNRDDMTIEVYDTRGRQIARCDIDFNGNTGAEHLAVPLVEAGSYRVVVEPLGAGGAYWIGSSFLGFEALEAIAPAAPEDAAEVTPGETIESAVGGGGSNEQWFTFTAPSEGLFVFNTGNASGDLVIEAYDDGNFENHMQYSDQDRNGSTGNERILLDMVEGRVVYLKVRPLSAGNDVEFEVRSQFMDTSE